MTILDSSPFDDRVAKAKDAAAVVDAVQAARFVMLEAWLGGQIAEARAAPPWLGEVMARLTLVYLEELEEEMGIEL